MVKNLLVSVLFFFLVSFCTSDFNISDFVEKYKFEINTAKILFQKVEPEIKIQSKIYNTDNNFISAIVFPELIRYSIYRDFFETKMLEFFYIKDGAKAANFSIGMFQMKPSFVEQLEKQVKKDTLLKKYLSITSYKSRSLQEIRTERLERMKTPKWQITYANCFYNIVNIKFQLETFKTIEDKIAFYATAYNHGFNCSKEEIHKWMKIKSFPNGVNYSEPSYSYANISVYFYRNLN